MALGPTIHDLIITHNGDPTEFSYTWDNTTGTLTTDGFREYGSYFTWMHVSFSLLAAPTIYIDNYLTIADSMDSNDIVATLLAYLSGAIAGLGVTTVSVTPARAQVTYDMYLSFYDFTQLVPSVTVTTDGTCAFAVDSAGGTSTAIQLAAVSGISAARGRLIAWDWENAIYRSAMLDSLDFVPSLETQASVGKAQAVRGKIVFIAGHADGYIVYSTSNIVRAIYSGDDYVFRYVEGANYGISDPRHIAAPYGLHIIYSPFGVQALDAGTGEITPIAPELDNYLAQYPWPLSIRLLEERYIVIGLPYLLRTDRILRANRGLYIKPLDITYTPGVQAIPNYPMNANNYAEYDRFIIFDSKLKRFGSCDLRAALLFSATPINATGTRLGKLPYGKEEQEGMQGTGLGFMMPNKKLYMATRNTINSSLHFRGVRMQKLGWSTLLEVHVEMAPHAASAWQIVVKPYDDALDNTTLATWTGPIQGYAEYTIERMDITALTQDIKVYGNYHLTQLKAVMLPHGKI